MARLFPGDDTHVNTFRILGTHGYMAPEYAMHGYLSVKTDVFSFGVLVLEIVSARKNYDKLLGEEKADLLSYTWMLFRESKASEIIDPNLTKYNLDEVAMCIQLGLLCCQSTVSARPDMNKVHLMLCSDSFDLPIPGKPVLQGRRGQWTTTNAGFALTNTNPDSTKNTTTGGSKDSVGSSFTQDFSRNSISYSSFGEGR